MTKLEEEESTCHLTNGAVIDTYSVIYLLLKFESERDSGLI